MSIEPESILKNRYRIIRLLGKGGMGSVFLAFDQNLEMEVAIKSNHNPSPESTTQFFQEARLLAALHHPNLPRVIDHFLLNGDEYLVMDYIKGQDIQEYLDQNHRFTLDTVLTYAKQLGDAVHFLHCQNPPIIHRDIKPANIKLDAKGNCILVDFGIAKSGSSSQATSAGAKGYTPGYAPPEQYGNSRTGPYSDQYSLAATLFHMLTGQRPADSVQRALGNAVLTPLHLLMPDLPVYMAGVFERALSIRPEDRYNSVDEFIRCLIDPAFQPQEKKPAFVQNIPTKPKSSMAWLFAALGGLVLIALIGAGIIIVPGLLSKNSKSAGLMESTSPPSTQTVLQLMPTETIQPAIIPAPSETPQPSPTDSPTLSPTTAMERIGGGGKIAFISNRSEDGVDQIWVMNVYMDDSGAFVTDEPQQLTFDPFSKSQPAWSPDGSKIIYSAPGPADSGSLGREIWILDLMQPDVPAKNLSYLKGDDFDPIFSPDGKYIAFVNKGRYNDVRQIYFMQADGREQRRLSPEYDEYSPMWSPDMKLLVNVIQVGGHQYLFKHLWVGDIAPTPFPTPRPYDQTTMFGQLGEVTDPAWSSDGQFIAYARIQGKQFQIYSAETRSFGAKKSLLTGETGYNRWPAWSPDGQWIVYTTKKMDSNQEEIFIMTSTGLLKTNLTMHPANDRQPAWQPMQTDD